MDDLATLNLSDPLVVIMLAGAGFLFLLLLMAVRASMRTAKLAEPLAQQMGALGQRVQALGEGQERLAGGLHHVSEAQAQFWNVHAADAIQALAIHFLQWTRHRGDLVQPRFMALASRQ